MTLADHTVDAAPTTLQSDPGTTAAPRLPLSAPVNLRDLGGTAVDGGTVRPGFAIRADDLSTATPESADALVAAGLRAVVDLRSADEVGITGRGVLGTRPEVSYHHVPFLADIGRAAAGTDHGDGDADRHDPAELLDQSRFGPMYLRMVEQAAPQIVTALAVIAHSPGTVAFHCAAGQDRTGVLAAALLLTLGADETTIVADYARTGESSTAIQERLAPVMAPLLARFGFDLDAAARAAVRTGFSEAPMRELLATLADRHGDPLAPLRAAGLTDGLVARLRERALVPAEDAA